MEKEKKTEIAIGISHIASGYRHPKPKIKIPEQEPSRTQQSQKAEADINNILAKHQVNPLLAGGIGTRTATWGQTFPKMSFHEMSNKILEAQRQFDELPSIIRTEFDNDPGKLLDFIGDEKNRKRAQELGLIETPEAPDDKPVPVHLVTEKGTPVPSNESVKTQNGTSDERVE